MEKQILEILKACMALKENGHDAFFDYSPHVDTVYIRVHINGWVINKDADIHMGAPSKPSDIYSAEHVQDELEKIKDKLMEYLK